MEFLLGSLAGLGVGVLAGSLLSLWGMRHIVPQTISAVGEALLTPGAVPEVQQAQEQVVQDLFKDLAAQMEPEPLPKELDWMNE